MRCLKKNKQTFHYYLYAGKQPVKDKDGLLTGENAITYLDPVECKGNISAGSGDSQVELFGTKIIYDKVIVLDDITCPIDTNSLLCLDITPQPYEQGETPAHDYTVKAVAKSLNSISIAISEVNANENKG